MRRFNNDTLFAFEFLAGETTAQLQFNERMKMGGIELVAVSFRGTTNGGEAMYLDIDGMSMACATENVPGFPVPMIINGQGAAAQQAGGTVFHRPWRIATPNRSSMQTIGCTIRQRDGSNYAHTGNITVWLRALGTDVHESLPVRNALDWQKPGQSFSGAGNYDTRFDWVPSQAEAAHNLPHSGFSLKHN